MGNGIRRSFASAIAVGALVPAGAHAATVGVVETGPFTPTGERSTMTFEGAAGEANSVSFAPAGGSGEQVSYTVVDTTAPLTAGAGCTGGGAPGTPATCSFTRSRPPTCVRTICTDLGRATYLEAKLGDGDDSFDSTAVLAGDGGGGELRAVTDGAEGADTIATGAAVDSVDPGPGPDSVRAGAAYDVIEPEPVADGADLLDLGPGGGAVDYSAAQLPLAISLDGLGNDGPAGDGDNVTGATVIEGGAASDLIAGGEADEFLYGNDGSDLILGGGGDDQTQGGTGSDEIRGGAGDDQEFEIGSSGGDDFFGGPGDDSAIGSGANDLFKGGGGEDQLYGEGGDDLLVGGSGRDALLADGGADRLRGGAGADRIGSGHDHDRDRMDCGPGTDRAKIGDGDVQRRCEVLV